MTFLNLIRYKNLLFIIGLQFLIRYAIIHPLFKTWGLETSYLLPNWQFFLLVAATVFIAAAGYVINDYFDTRIDAINKPEKVIVGQTITKKQASLIHQLFTGIGIAMGLFVAYLCKSISLGLLIIMVPGLLWFYSASYKRQFLTGNIIVAINASFIPLIIGIAEISYLSLDQNYGNLLYQTPISKTIYAWVCGFAAFAFIGTLIREIIKDMEDEKGDREMESRSMAIVLGIKKTKLVVYVLIALTLAAILYLQFNVIKGYALIETPEENTLSLRYIIFGILIPFGYLVFLLIKAKNKLDFHQASNFMKFILVTGSLYAFIFYFLLCRAQGMAMFDLFIIK